MKQEEDKLKLMISYHLLKNYQKTELFQLMILKMRNCLSLK